MIACEEKYAVYSGAERMQQIVVAQRLPGDDQSYRVQMRGVSRDSTLRIGWVQLQSVTAPTNDLLLPEALMCAVILDDFTYDERRADKVTVKTKLVAAQKKVTYSWEAIEDVEQPEEEYAVQLEAHWPSVDMSKLFLAAILDAPGDAVYLLPSQAGHSWAPQVIPQSR